MQMKHTTNLIPERSELGTALSYPNRSIGMIFCIGTSFPRQAEQVLIKLSIKMPNFSL